MMAVQTYAVEVDVPKGVSLAEVLCYLREAITIWCKQLQPGDDNDPGDPLFDFDKWKVKVYRLQAGSAKNPTRGA